MFRSIRWENLGQHVAVSDPLNELKEGLARRRENRPTRGMYLPCYGKRCAGHHPVPLGTVIVGQLMVEREMSL